MPNWYTTSLVFEGKRKEIESLYKTLEELERRNTPLVENGFGTTWLGCLVTALGGDWQEIRCRGEWTSAEYDGNVLRIFTETAWNPCFETYDFICKKFPSLTYLYSAEEPGMAYYQTNDRDGRYFPARHVTEICLPDGEHETEYFSDLEDAFEWISQKSGRDIHSTEDVGALHAEWEGIDEDAYCYLSSFRIV